MKEQRRKRVRGSKREEGRVRGSKRERGKGEREQERRGKGEREQEKERKGGGRARDGIVTQVHRKESGSIFVSS